MDRVIITVQLKIEAFEAFLESANKTKVGYFYINCEEET